MSGSNSRNRQSNGISGGSLLGAAVGVVVGLAVVEHTQAQQENRESVVQGVLRWVREDLLDLPSGRRYGSGTSAAARRILTRSDIAALPVRTLEDNQLAQAQSGFQTEGTNSHDDDDKAHCVICRDQYSPGDSVMTLPCFHDYHADCIRDYLESTQGPLCPVCRHPVSLS